MFLDLTEKYGAPMDHRDIDDALRVPTANAEALSAQILAQIRDSLAAINRKQDTIGKDVSSASERIARLEERNERINRLETTVLDDKARIDALMKDKDRRDGAAGFVTALLKSPALGWLVGAVVSAWAILTGKVHIS
jgi:predicted RNase H-like nuclease (RuvC/YqgF family)